MTCGYLCPRCEGKGFTDEGEACDWCVLEQPLVKPQYSSISDEEWQRSVHEGNCCGHWEEAEDKAKSNP
jgi:hypothetical protein